jgi:hypothetical protein
VLFLAQPLVGAQERPDLPDSFGGNASSAALNLALVTPALVPVEDLFDTYVAEGRATYEPDNQEGRASLVLPGNAGVMGPGLVCGEFLGPQAPEQLQPFVDACNGYRYPLSVVVDPLNPDGQTEGAGSLGEAGDPFSVQAAGAHAHAGTDATTTDAEVGAIRLTGAPGFGSLGALLEQQTGQAPDDALVAADGVTARTDQRFVDGKLVLDARATVAGLRLLGGIVRIGSIDSHSKLVLEPSKPPVPTTTFDVTGVEVAGRPARIGEHGLEVAGAGSGPVQDRLNAQVAQLLQDRGLRLTVLPTAGDVGDTPGASIGGLSIELTTPIDGLPPVPGPTGDADLNGAYGIRLNVGATGVRGFTDRFTDDASFEPVAGSGDAGSFDSGLPSPSVEPPAGDVPTARPPSTPATPRLQPIASGLLADRVRLLYLCFTLAGVALCLTPRLTLPARLGGPGGPR